MKHNKLGFLIIILIIAVTGAVLLTLRSDPSPSESSSASRESEQVSASAFTEMSERSESPSSAAANASAAARVTTFADNSLSISAPYAVLLNASTDEILYEKNTDSKIHPASLTKLLTAITVLTYMDTDTVITVGTELELLPEHSSLCLIKQGHRLTVYDLLTGMLVASGNDAAYTLGVNTARFLKNNTKLSDKDAISYFTDLMNSLAVSLGCTQSSFTTPDGFDSDGQYTTVSDMMLICKYALSFKEIREIVSTVKKKVVFKSGENVTWSNSNLLLHKDSPYYYPEAIGMKTGTTSLAGKCLASAAEINGSTYIAIVADCESDQQRYSCTKSLFSLAE